MDALPKKESFLGLLEFGESMEQDRFVEDQLLGNGTFINKSYISFSAARKNILFDSHYINRVKINLLILTILMFVDGSSQQRIV